MPKKDIYHDTVKTALLKDGWTITHDPLKLEIGKKELFIDLGAEQLIGAARAEQKIAVEIKSFIGRSDIDDLEKALGQYTLYYDVLEDLEPDRELYLAIKDLVFSNLFEEPIGQVLLRKKRLKLIVFNPTQEVISRWIP
ncbi:MAG: fatty-acid synthase [Okeania sp. SIO3B5]|uniref:XisH family protein n=1 Tax=Okeania sp. SIO3B5 TaxID=2607811 RepID=UPI0013FEDBAB|nr:XisH family protein [Okeania sp. SIO3B5]NEO53642.1 fatty-acid synthase [Okeania sp. SIO3B5]